MSWTERLYRDEDGKVDIEPRCIPEDESDLLKIYGGNDYDVFIRGNKFIARSCGNHHEAIFDNFRELEEYVNFDYYCEMEERIANREVERESRPKKKKRDN